MLSIDQDRKPDVSLPNAEGKKALSDILRTYAIEKKKERKFSFKGYKENYFDINIIFKKRQMF